LADERELRMRVLSLETLLDLSQNLNLFIDVEGLANFFLLTLMGQFSLARAALFIEKRVTTGRLVPVAARGIERDRLESVSLSWGAGLGKSLRSASRRVDMREVAAEESPDAAELLDLGFRSAVPLAVKGRAFGAVLLGERVHAEPPSSLEDQMLASMARIGAIALENLVLYESIRRSNEELKDKNTRLEEMDRLKSEFLSNAGHELKTPLTCILSYAEFLRDHPAAESHRTEFSTNILTQGEKLLGLIEEILDLGTLSASTLGLNPTAVEISGLIAREADRTRFIAAEKGLTFAFEVGQEPGTVSLDEKQTRKIVRCLLDNAVKFTPEGGAVTLWCGRTGDEVEVRVRDTGIGIAHENRALIFERFRQVDGSTTRAYSGLGIGLAIARGLAELQGGRISVESELGKGSEFTLRLPCRAAVMASAG